MPEGGGLTPRIGGGVVGGSRDFRASLIQILKTLAPFSASAPKGFSEIDPNGFQNVTLRPPFQKGPEPAFFGKGRSPPAVREPGQAARGVWAGLGSPWTRPGGPGSMGRSRRSGGKARRPGDYGPVRITLSKGGPHLDP